MKILNSCRLLMLLSLVISISVCRCSMDVADTETGNPDVIACMSLMTQESLKSIDIGVQWQPSSYLDTSNLPQTLAFNKSLPKTLSAASANMLLSADDSISDTIIISDTVALIYDTVFFRDTIYSFDTIRVLDTLVQQRIMWDTVVLGNSIYISSRKVVDSVLINDVVLVKDTTETVRKKVVLTIMKYNSSDTIIYAQVDTFWINPAFNDSLPRDISDKNYKSYPNNWHIDSISIQAEQPQIVYLLQSNSTAPATGSFMIIQANFDGFRIDNNQAFLSRQRIENNILLENLAYNEKDQTMSIFRYNPLAVDTVESLLVKYNINTGANFYSGNDDQLLSIERLLKYRLGKCDKMQIRITPDFNQTISGGSTLNRGMVDIIILRSNGSQGEFSGIIDRTDGLSGLYIENGLQYQVRCKADGALNFNEIAD